MIWITAGAALALAVIFFVRIIKRIQADKLKAVAGLHQEIWRLEASKKMQAGIINQQAQLIGHLSSRAPSYKIVRAERSFIPHRVRNRLFKWFYGQCAYCRVQLTKRQATIDHIIPLAKGGSSHISNLCISCADCNRRKGQQHIGWQPFREPPLK